MTVQNQARHNPSRLTGKEGAAPTRPENGTAVPLGNSENAAPAEIAFPRKLLTWVVWLDVLTCVASVIGRWVPILGLVGLVSIIAASILSCIMSGKPTAEEYKKKVKNVMWAHISFTVVWAVALGLALLAVTRASVSMSLAYAAAAIGIVSYGVLIAAFALAWKLQREIKAADAASTK